MDTFLSEEIRAVREAVSNFAQKEILPFVEIWDSKHQYPSGAIKKMGLLGYLGAIIPEEFGGTNMGFLAQSVIAEEISRASGSLRVVFNCQTAGVSLPIARYGTSKQKEKYIPALVTGEKTGAFAITEPNSGSDVMAMKTRATLDGETFVLNGTKTWISNATIADVAVVYAYTEPDKKAKGMSVFIVDMDRQGITTKEIPKMGLYSAPTGEIVFEDVKLPKESLLGNAGEGVKMLFSSLNQTRLMAAAGAVGIAQACLDAAVKYCNERSQFGQTIGNFQMNQEQIAVAATEIEAARLLVYRAADQKDGGYVNNGRETSMAKYFACETASRVAEVALKILSAYGYSTEYPVARLYRDAKAVQIVEGTSNIQKMIIALDVLGIRKAGR
ncbi:MAG: glutaryl-CoA dehydrogenase Acd [Thermodesulfobacteriota bacterium]